MWSTMQSKKDEFIVIDNSNIENKLRGLAKANTAVAHVKNGRVRTDEHITFGLEQSKALSRQIKDRLSMKLMVN